MSGPHGRPVPSFPAPITTAVAGKGKRNRLSSDMRAGQGEPMVEAPASGSPSSLGPMDGPSALSAEPRKTHRRVADFRPFLFLSGKEKKETRLW